MAKLRKRIVEKTISACLSLVNTAGLTREELVVVLGQMLIRVGYTFYFQYEKKEEDEAPPDKISQEQAEKLYFENPSTGTTLMKIGFDLQEVLLLKN